MSLVVKTYLTRTPCVRGLQSSFHWTPRLSRSQVTSAWRQPSRRIPRTSFCANTSDSPIVIPKLTAEQLEVTIQDRSVPLVIDIYATWCGPCLLMAKELEKVAQEMKDRVRIVKVDSDEEQALSSQLQIQGLPTLILLGTNPKKPALRLEGMIEADTLIKIINEEL